MSLPPWPLQLDVGSLVLNETKVFLNRVATFASVDLWSQSLERAVLLWMLEELGTWSRHAMFFSSSIGSRVVMPHCLRAFSQRVNNNIQS